MSTCKKEIIEGWLIKSPPIKRIWRARWRRRWFALKPGELPGQYFLAYYTDQTCRKLKGMIDLDHCEQVDSGLFMERKFEHVFNVKTPRRTYYMAADSDEDMRYWVNCICQVCGLQDLSKCQQSEQQSLYLNVGNKAVKEKPVAALAPHRETSSIIARSTPNEEPTYQNNDFFKADAATEYANRETMAISEQQMDVVNNNSYGSAREYYNELTTTATDRNSNPVVQLRRRIPENLKLSEVQSTDTAEPSPALSTSSGPYIPISECFSGSPVLLNSRVSQSQQLTPLNSLNPKFYDTPRSHINIGNLNLTADSQQYSPKRSNTIPGATSRPKSSGRSSPSDSESVFTDDDVASSYSSQHRMTHASATMDRRLRPSDSSVENEIIGWTYTQRFSKVPDELKSQNTADPPPRPPKREPAPEPPRQGAEESATPLIGPKDRSCGVDESYDIPRSHRMPPNSASYRSPSLMNPDSPFIQPEDNFQATSTPAIYQTDNDVEPKIVNRAHFYTNAAPTKVEGNVFRYDFIDHPAPAVNRNLKPKAEQPDILPGFEQLDTPPPTTTDWTAPSVDRKLKPTTPKFNTMSRVNRGTVSLSMSLSKTNIAGQESSDEERKMDSLGPMLRQSMQIVPSRSDDKLQYLDLDHTPKPQRTDPIRKLSSASTNNIPSSSGGVTAPAIPVEVAGEANKTVYKTVDFVKTEAFKRTRQDVEMNRSNM